MNLAQALAGLDPMNDDHWTGDGLPLMGHLIDLTGDDTLKRYDVTHEFPTITRAQKLDEAGKAVDEPTEPPLTFDTRQPLESDVPTLPGLPAGTSVLDLPRGQVTRSPELTQAALGEIGEKILEAQKRQTATDEELAQLNQKTEILKRVAMQHNRNRPKGEQLNDIQQYLKAQHAARAARAKRAMRFLEAGTTAREVADALRDRSPLDASLAHRRGSPALQRKPAQPVTL